MQIHPYTNLMTAALNHLAFLYDTDIPDNADLDVQVMVNEAIAIRHYQRNWTNNVANVRLEHTFTPVPGSAPLMCSQFFPAWQQFSPGLSSIYTTRSRIIPRVKLPALDQRDATAAAFYNEATALTILAHKAINNNNMLFTTGGGFTVGTQYSKTAEGYFLVAEYDFGAQIDLRSVSVFSLYTPTIFNYTDSYLQAYVDGAWVDILNIYATLRTTTAGAAGASELPSGVSRAQKFRFVNKAATAPWGNGYAPFGMHFFGEYVEGKNPRTLGKFKSMTLLPISSGATYNATLAWSFCPSADRTVILGRYMALLHLSITDDLKQMGTKDMYVENAQWQEPTNYLNNEPSVPAVRTLAQCVEGRAI